MKKTLTFLVALVVSLLTLQASAAMYIVGDAPFGGWKPAGGVQMNDNGDGTYSYSATITGTVYFVFGDGQSSSWDTFNSSYRYGPTGGDTNVSADTWVTTQKGGDHGAYYFSGDGSTYEFTFDANDKRFKITSQGGGSVNPTGKLYILGEAGGNSWDPSVGVEMSSSDGNTFTTQVTFNGEHSEEDANVSYFSFTTKLASSSDDWDGIRIYRLLGNLVDAWQYHHAEPAGHKR